MPGEVLPVYSQHVSSGSWYSFILLQGDAILLEDVTLSYLVFRRLSTSLCVSPRCYANNDMFFITSPQDS